jgi:hypothetical protein
MSFLYVDESIHDRAGFILAAAVWSEVRVDEAIEAILRRVGLRPRVDEFKSSALMAQDPARRALRDEFRWLLMRSCKIAVAVCGMQERKELGQQTVSLALCLDVPPGEIFLDEGLKVQTASSDGWIVRSGCDSREVFGIQLADCAAHTIAGVLLSELGHVTKRVPTVDPLYAPDVELDFKLWASIRYALAGQPVHPDHEADDWEPIMHPFGLSISQGCPPAVVDAVEKRLGSVWVGCIH